MFEGFTQETIDFLWGIRFNNDRGWFEPRKEVYRNVLLEPMRALAAQTQEGILERFPHCGLNLKVSRIYRDARRLFGRGPYKDHLWFSLFRWENESHGAHPVLWFELAPDKWSYGMGFWCPQAVVMEKHRARMDRDYKPLLRLHNKLAKQSQFVLDGPEYSRKKTPPHPKLTDWYNKRSLTVGHEEPLSEAIYSPKLPQQLTEGFCFLMPYYDYFSTIWTDPDPRAST